jgi:hypothetical protein
VWPLRWSTPPGLGAQRKNVARLDEVARLRFRIGEQADGLRAVLGADAGGDVVRGVDRDGEVGFEALAVIEDHAVEAERVARSLVIGAQMRPRPHAFGGARGAVADGLHVLRVHVHIGHKPCAHRLRAALAELLVVFCRAGRIGMPLDQE